MKIRGKLTYANVMASIAVFLVLGGGAAFAATQLPKNSVGPKQLKKAAVTPAKLSKAAKATLTGPRGATGNTGAKGDRGETGPRGPSNAYYTFSNSQLNNSKTISITVPAGNYVASGSMFAVNSEATNSSEVECKLQSPGNKNYGVTDVTLPPHPSGASATYTHPEAETALSIGAGGGVISLECNSNGLATVQLYQARILATQVETLTTS